MLLVSGLLIVGSLFIPPAEGISRPINVAGAILFAGLFSLIFNHLFAASMDRQVRRLYKEGTNKGVFGQHEIEIDDEGLVERTEVNETRQSWQGVERVGETDEYAFIYISSVMAHVIPKRPGIDGDPDEFITRAKQMWLAANSNVAAKHEA